MDWNKVLNWKLLEGSHEFPGPDGGTCINEAAIVAAGFEYKAIENARDCPPCFSQVIAQYALALNDNLPDDLRQELLMPYVTRLAGTADSDEIEEQRVDAVVMRLGTVLMPIALWYYPELAEKFARARNQVELLVLAKQTKLLLGNVDATLRLAFDPENVDLRLDYASHAIFQIADLLLETDYSNISNQVWTEAVKSLDAMLQIGNQADPLDISLVCSRMNAAKQKQQELV